MRYDDDHKGPRKMSFFFDQRSRNNIPELQTEENDIEAAEQDVYANIIPHVRMRTLCIRSRPDIEPES